MHTGNWPRTGLLLSLAITLFVSCEKQNYGTAPASTTPPNTKTTDGLVVQGPVQFTMWFNEANIPLPPFIKNWSGLHSAACFSINGKGYIVAGGVKNVVGMQGASNEVWCFDTATRAWTQKVNFPGYARMGFATFVVNNLGYVCTGVGADYITPTTQTWQYDPSTDTWTPKAAFPGGARSYATGVGLNGKGYVGTGAPTSGGVDGGYYDWWEYNPASDHWTQKTGISSYEGRWGAVAFADPAGGKAYLATGIQFPYQSAKSDCYEYNPATNAWTQMPDIPVGRVYAVGVSIPAGGVVGTGYAGWNYNDFYEFSFAKKTWGKMLSMPGQRFNAEAFAIGDLIYAGGGLYGLGSNDKATLDDFHSLYW